MAKWEVYEGNTYPSCTHCGMSAPFARYSRKAGLNARYITDFCPYCGSKMTAIDECAECPYATVGHWNGDGICFACRGSTWIYGKKQNERILEDY